MDSINADMRPRLWMKGFRARRSELNNGNLQENGRRERRPKNNGATGLGFRLRVTVCPKLDQVFLAFSTLLFFLSIDLLVLTIIKVGPGLLSSKFQPANCRVLEKHMNTSSYCYITTMKDHGKISRFPCLRIYVTTDVANDDVTSTRKLFESLPMMSQSSNGSGSITTKKVIKRPLEKTLLFQNEFHLIGEDYIHRPCSFLPTYCTGDKRDLAWQVYNYSLAIGEIDSTTDCFYSDSSGLKTVTRRVVMRSRMVTYEDMLHTILWPILGLILSVFCCSVFWKQNRHRIPRLFIYNSWSPS